MRELRGEVKFGMGLYHNEHFEQLISAMAGHRKEALEADNNEKRKPIYTEEFKQWQSYIKNRLKELPEELALSDNMKNNLTHVYQQHKDRKENILLPSHVIDMHFDYAVMFKFNPVIDIQFLEQMIHPSRGYLCHIPSGITYDSLVELYETLIVATFEKLSGQVNLELN